MLKILMVFIIICFVLISCEDEEIKYFNGYYVDTTFNIDGTHVYWIKGGKIKADSAYIQKCNDAIRNVINTRFTIEYFNLDYDSLTVKEQICCLREEMNKLRTIDHYRKFYFWNEIFLEFLKSKRTTKLSEEILRKIKP